MLAMEQFLTLTRWWVVPVIWLPVSLWCISMSVRMGLSLAEIVPLIALGIFIWTFIEYTLHRFLFHIKTKSYWFVTHTLSSFSVCYNLVPACQILMLLLEPLQGKHGTLSSSRVPSQAPNGPPSTRLSSYCNIDFMLSCKHLIIIYTAPHHYSCFQK